MSRANLATEPRPRCPVCNKAVYRSFTEARHGAEGAMRGRKGMEALMPYWSERCRAYHVGSSTGKIRKRERNGR